MSRRAQRKALSKLVSAELNGMGSDADEVAATLRSAGVRGYRGNSVECAIARYLSAVLCADPMVKSVSVQVHSITVRTNPGYWLGTRVRVPSAIAHFISGFDRGRFPELIGKGGLHLDPWAVDGQPDSGLLSNREETLGSVTRMDFQ